MTDNPKYVTMVNHHDVAATQQVYTNRMFTERGIYTALMKSNKPIAE
jgi:prophage antirepressor-like protein